MSLFKMEMPPWFYRERAVHNGLTDARLQLATAPADSDAERDARQKVARFEYTAIRLASERKHAWALANALLNYGSENV